MSFIHPMLPGNLLHVPELDEISCQAMAGMKPETLARVQVYKEPIDFKALNLGYMSKGWGFFKQMWIYVDQLDGYMVDFYI